MPIETYTLKNEEILRVGVHKKFEFTPAVLREIYDNFYKLKAEVKPTVKLGHGEQEILERSGYPAAGYISELELSPDGDVLMATISDVPKEVKELIEARAYAQKSAEVVIEYEDETKKEKYGAVLIGLAILGEELPEIKTLADIKQLYLSSSKSEVILVALSASKDAGTESKEEKKMPEDPKKSQGAAGAAADSEAAKKMAADKGAGGAPPTMDEMVSGLEKTVSTIIEMAKAQPLADNVIAKIGEALKPMIEKIKPAEEPAKKEGDAAGGSGSADGDSDSPAMLELKKKVQQLEADMKLAQKKEKDAKCETVNLSDKQYFEQLVKEAKISPPQREKLEKLFFSINKTEANIIRLSDKESVSIKELVKEVLGELPARLDLSEQTKDSSASDTKPPEAVQISKMKEMCPGYFKAEAAAGADKK